MLIDGLRAKVFVDSSATNVNEGSSATNPIDLTLNVTVEGKGEEDEVVREEVKVRLAGVLPGLARWSQLALNAVPNELVDVSVAFDFGCVNAPGPLTPTSLTWFTSWL